jgi:hypothetical protein
MCSGGGEKMEIVACEKAVVRDIPHIIQYLRPGWIGKMEFIHDEYGTKYTTEQLNRGPRLGVAVAVREGPGLFKVGIVLLSPKEPLFVIRKEKALFEEPDREVKIEKTVKRHIKNIDWKRAMDLAYTRAIESETPFVYPYLDITLLNKLSRRGLDHSYFRFIDRCLKVFKN